MWIPILLIASLPFSGAVWAKREVRGVVGRAITIDCHYAAENRSHTKYWCRGRSLQCTVLVETNGQHGRSGRVSITDNPARGTFTVTVDDLQDGDTGWYRCGITTSADHPIFNVYLEVSDEPVSVPVLGFLSPANVSCLGGSVTVSCESVRGSLPINYSWYEKTPSGDSKISDNNALDLHCQSFKHQHHQYYCTASNQHGSKSSEMVNMSIFSSDVPCSVLVKINGTVAVWGKKNVTGDVGRAITIDCHYATEYRSHTKYWCRGWGRQCTDMVETNGQHGRSGRVSITDIPALRIFTVTVEDLHSGDTGRYICGIRTSADHPMFSVHLQVSDEPVSAPVLRYLSAANASRLGGSVSVSCESVRGSLPIRYTWFEKNEHWVSTTVYGNQLDLSCEILGGQHRQYYCTASNNHGTKSSESLNVKVFKGAGTCSYVTEMNNAGALRVESEVHGVVGRAITIDCHYAAVYRSHTKFWCNGTSRQCTHAVETNGEHGQSGRVSMSDNPARGIFTVTVEDLNSGDTGWYSCGITTPGEPTFKVHLQVSEEPVSVPVLGCLSPDNVSCLGGSVTVSCESVRGSLPINHTWYEKTPSGDSKISDNNALDLHCQSFKHQHHQYYCTASNNKGSKSSEMVNVSISSNDVSCSFLVKIDGTVSGAVWAKRDVRGVVGTATTIDCYYAAEYRSHTKYWCRGMSLQCTVLVETNEQHGRSGRLSITDNPARGIFTVTVDDLQDGDTGWYRCGIKTSADHPILNVHLEVSDEPMSAPVLRYLSPANASHLGGSVSVSCESVRGSLPIHYTWFEKNEHWVSTTVSGNQLDLSCEILEGQHRQYYCRASNNRGTKSSEILNVKVFKGAGTCSYVTEINNAVAGALWAESEVRGIVGRAITIDCHYAAVYRSHTKYWCRETSRQCTHVVETNGKRGQNGTVSITDNPARGIFTVTVEDLHSGDTGWYKCGITTPGEPTFKVHLQVSEEPVSVPVLGCLSPANVSCLGGSVTVSCESIRGSLPINHTWYEKTPSGDSKISDNNVLDLHCQSFKHQHHQYYCTASNNNGTKSSEMVNVSITSSDVPCSFLVKFNGTGK
ncbi:Fc receptor-like protein 5 [Leucoraja erinacea]|uniref:Fc receptor-like protein 5 n=1 Tax=Leucoraja erinaceus TaxID=7782 RepID=UPI002457B192|nr:Fc receptor-like protein 5 [Leucoraja erinacea]